MTQKPSHSRRALGLISAPLLILTLLPTAGSGCASHPTTPMPTQTPPKFTVEDALPNIGGKPMIVLRAPHTAPRDQPQILEVDLLPGRGLNVFQIRAYLPKKGVVNLLHSISPEEAARRMSGGLDDYNGNQSFLVGGAILVPYANRIRGLFMPEQNEIKTTVLQKTVKLPANWKGKNADAEPHAIHGLILDREMDTIQKSASADEATVNATLDAKDFGGHWLSSTELAFSAKLDRTGFVLSVIGKNAGDAPLPIGIGWHPYFEIPSGNRAQARLEIPARERAIVDNADNVFPTGKLEKRSLAPFALQSLSLDDTFTALQRDSLGQAIATLVDPQAGYALRVKALTPTIKVFQVYAPSDQPFVAVEPQFNLSDPFSKAWKKTDTGMVTLEPGTSTIYSVALELVNP